MSDQIFTDQDLEDLRVDLRWNDENYPVGDIITHKQGEPHVHMESQLSIVSSDTSGYAESTFDTSSMYGPPSLTVSSLDSTLSSLNFAVSSSPILLPNLSCSLSTPRTVQDDFFLEDDHSFRSVYYPQVHAGDWDIDPSKHAQFDNWYEFPVAIHLSEAPPIRVPANSTRTCDPFTLETKHPTAKAGSHEQSLDWQSSPNNPHFAIKLARDVENVVARSDNVTSSNITRLSQDLNECLPEACELSSPWNDVEARSDAETETGKLEVANGEKSQDSNELSDGSEDVRLYYPAFAFFGLLKIVAQADPPEIEDSPGSSGGSSERSDIRSLQTNSTITSFGSSLVPGTKGSGITELGDAGSDESVVVASALSKATLSHKPLDLLCWHAAVGIKCKGRIGRNCETRRLYRCVDYIFHLASMRLTLLVIILYRRSRTTIGFPHLADAVNYFFRTKHWRRNTRLSFSLNSLVRDFVRLR